MRGLMAPDCTTLTCEATVVARLAMQSAEKRWQLTSFRWSESTIGASTPSLMRVCWTSTLAARLAMARDDSPFVLRSSDSASATNGASPRSSSSRTCRSTFSIRLAMAQHEWRSTSVSPERSIAMMVEMDRSHISILFSSIEVRQLIAAATSRNTSISSVRAMRTNGSRMPCRTTSVRYCGEIQRPRRAASACRCALRSSQHARATSASGPPSSTICCRWLAFAAKLDSAKAA
mmetsp:Transcript_1019/g.2119  ORF Transcript_1019/g.2119 Transcript_1019/m.2119 type:complete len:233 (+) Transcript_1019:7464-8162(+)